MNPEAPKDLQAQQPKREHFIWDLVKFTIGALIIVAVIRIYIAQPFIVSGLSMYPTFNNADYLIVDELSYRFEAPQRGDVIVFRHTADPANPNDPINKNSPSDYYIKRIIGLPGEHIVSNKGVITVYPNATSTDGIVLNEPYIEADHKSYDSWSVTLGPNEYWMMGDNRNESSDSRVWGPLNRSYFVGRPILRLFPFSAIGLFPGKENQ